MVQKGCQPLCGKCQPMTCEVANGPPILNALRQTGHVELLNQMRPIRAVVVCQPKVSQQFGLSLRFLSSMYRCRASRVGTPANPPRRTIMTLRKVTSFKGPISFLPIHSNFEDDRPPLVLKHLFAVPLAPRFLIPSLPIHSTPIGATRNGSITGGSLPIVPAQVPGKPAGVGC